MEPARQKWREWERKVSQRKIPSSVSTPSRHPVPSPAIIIAETNGAFSVSFTPCRWRAPILHLWSLWLWWFGYHCFPGRVSPGAGRILDQSCCCVLRVETHLSTWTLSVIRCKAGALSITAMLICSGNFGYLRGFLVCGGAGYWYFTLRGIVIYELAVCG